MPTTINKGLKNNSTENNGNDYIYIYKGELSLNQKRENPHTMPIQIDPYFALFNKDWAKAKSLEWHLPTQAL